MYGDKWAISASDDSNICVWDLASGQYLACLSGHYGGVWAMLIVDGINGDTSDDSGPPYLVTGSTDRTARVWCLDGMHWKCAMTLVGHLSTVRCLAYGGRGSRVVSGSRDTSLRLWDITSGECLLRLHGQ